MNNKDYVYMKLRNIDYTLLKKIVRVFAIVLFIIALRYIGNIMGRQDNINGGYPGYITIDNVAYNYCDYRRVYCKHENGVTEEIFSIESEDTYVVTDGEYLYKNRVSDEYNTVDRKLIKYDVDGEVLGEFEYSDKTYYSPLNIKVVENYIVISEIKDNIVDDNVGYDYRVIFVESSTMAEVKIVTFTQQDRIRSSQVFDLYDISEDQLTLYYSSSSYGNLVDGLIFDINTLDFIGATDISAIGLGFNVWSVIVNNNAYSIAASRDSISMYDDSFYPIKKVELEDYHYSSVNKELGVFMATNLSSSKRKTHVREYDESLEVTDEYTLKLWCSNVSKLNDEYLACHRISERVRLPRLLRSKSRYIVEETIIVKMSDYRV